MSTFGLDGDMAVVPPHTRASSACAARRVMATDLARPRSPLVIDRPSAAEGENHDQAASTHLDRGFV